MKDLKEQYNHIVSERQTIIDQINVLAENETVKEYFALREQNDKLASQQKDLYKQIKVEEYSSYQTLRIKTSGKDVLIPFLKAFILSVDLENKLIKVKCIKGLL